MNTEQFLVFLVDGGAGALVYLLLSKWDWYNKLTEPDVKRWLAFLFTALVAVAAWGGSILLGFTEAPGTGWQSIVVAIGDVVLGVFAAFGTSQLAHTKELKNR